MSHANAARTMKAAVMGPVLVAVAVSSCGGASPSADAAVVPGPASEAGVLDRAIEKLSSPDGPRGVEVGPDPGPMPADAGPAPDGSAIFAGCPGPDRYVGNPAWRDTLVIASPAPQLCASWVETDGSLDPNTTVNRLKETLARMGMATIAPGTYKLIGAAGPAPFALPVCLVRADRKPLAAGTGTIARRMQGPASIFDVSLPVANLGRMAATLVWQGPGPLAVMGVESLRLCPDGNCLTPGASSYFGECDVGGPPRKHVVSLENGTVELTVTVYRAGIGAGTEPASFLRASGTFKGVAFDQRDHFKLIYSPEHHHFTRNFAVLFDAPIEGACGLEIANLSGSGMGTRRPRAWAVSCQLDRLTEVKVTSAILQ